MSPVLIATIAGAITALCWGTGDWLAAKSSKKSNKYAISFAVMFSGALLVSIVLLFSEIKLPSAGQLTIIFLVAVLIYSAFLCFIKALSSGAVGIIVPLGSTYPLVTLILSVVFLGSIFSGKQIIAMLIIVLGATLLAYERNHKQQPIKVLHRATFFVLVASVFWGVAFFLADTIIDDVSWQVLVGFSTLFETIIAASLLAINQRRSIVSAFKQSLTDRTSLLVGVLLTSGAIAFYLGSERAGSVLIPTVISSGGPVVASILSAVVDKEKLGLLKRVGAAVAVAGIIALNIL